MRLWILAGLVGCTGTVDDTDDTDAPVPIVDTAPDDDHATDAWLRVVHLCPDLALPCDHDGDAGTPDGRACVGLYVAPSPIPLNDTPFPAGASTGFALPVVPGTYALEVRPWGASPTSEASGTSTTTLAPTQARTIVTYGLAQASTFGFRVGDTDRSAPADGMARVTVFHATNAFTALAYDVILGTSTTWTDLAFGTFGAATERAAGAVALGVSIDGDAAAEYAATLPLDAGDVVDVFLFDTGSPTAPIVALVHTLTSNEPEQIVLLPTGQ